LAECSSHPCTSRRRARGQGQLLCVLCHLHPLGRRWCRGWCLGCCSCSLGRSERRDRLQQGVCLQFHLDYHSSVKIPTWVFCDVPSGPTCCSCSSGSGAPALLAASVLRSLSCKICASAKLGISGIGLCSSAMLPTMLILLVSYYWNVDASGGRLSPRIGLQMF
jgi:hypothetical protein